MSRAGLAILLVVSFIASAPADITWNITYNDVVNDTGLGFDDMTLGPTRRSTFDSVLSYLNTVLDHSGTVDFVVKDSLNLGTGFLASSGPLFFNGPNGFKNGFLFDHATTGIDPSGDATPDASATFDFGYTWNSDTGTPTASEYDLFSVALHEVTHSLGFLSLVGSTGVSVIPPNGDPGVFSVYDSFLEKGNGTALFSAGGNFDGASADLISGDVFFGGANAKAANGGTHVPVYAPGTFAPGSSISHISSSITGAVMQYSIGTMTERRSYTAQELGILQDIGWSIKAVPEPSAFVFLSLVFAGMSGRPVWRKLSSLFALSV